MKPIVDVPFKVRGTVSYFAQLMEERLRANSNKVGWDKTHPLWLMLRLNEEVGELCHLLSEFYCDDGGRWGIPRDQIREKIEKVFNESADIGNFAMMIADRMSESWLE